MKEISGQDFSRLIEYLLYSDKSLLESLEELNLEHFDVEYILDVLFASNIKQCHECDYWFDGFDIYCNFCLDIKGEA
jgi:hypothetical protein